MRLLLDTHAFLWFVLNDPQSSATAQRLISDPANDVLISPASYWEVAIKVGLRKLDLHAPYDDFIQRGLVGNDFAILPIEPRHTSVLTTLPLHHRDPFDRLIVAQAMVENIPLVSMDAVLDQYPITRLW
ncbi:MAG TPA: type II toxin-antitoxin system VapC family toxin [Gemmataceae bacterium]|nr:type II toxin-antitoxin system VapC family toxin [Gemmataceae bacterium]